MGGSRWYLSRTTRRDEEGTREVGWSRSTGSPSKDGSNRRESGREGDHGQRSDGTTTTGVRDSRQPARGRRWHGSRRASSCSTRGAEVERHEQHVHVTGSNDGEGRVQGEPGASMGTRGSQRRRRGS